MKIKRVPNRGVGCWDSWKLLSGKDISLKKDL